eukprot:GHVO01014263.1.p1 GENE.GHVO01014263.1~~GHVO01014263.1.p1  ORF type:complete len:107 (-),score=10.69 GHVO01014263.1:106-426(-)
MKKGARYEGYSVDDVYIQTFWDILMNFDEICKRKFLQFCTGSERVPIGGLKELKLVIKKNGVEPTDRLPTSYTCFNCLLLPKYQHKDKLKRLLTIAIGESEGFGLQ